MFTMPGGKVVSRPRLGVVKTYAASVDPGTANDNTQGYSPGSIGVNTGTGRAFICRSAATASAKWGALDSTNFDTYAANNWYPSFFAPLPVNGSTLATGTSSFSPFLVKERSTWGSLGIHIGTLKASGNLQLALYNDSASQPSTLVDNTASITTGATGFVSASFSGGNHTLEPGLYWFGLAYDATASSSAICDSWPNIASSFVAGLLGSATGDTVAGFTQLPTGWTFGQTFGTWATVSSATATTVKNTPFGVMQNVSSP